MKIEISQTLKDLPVIDYRTIKPFQKGLKDLSKVDYARLLKSFKEFGFIVPMFLWKHKGDVWILDAHQRQRVLIGENIEPYELPYIEIDAATEQEAKKRLLVISSQYGKITQDGLDEFAFDLDDEWLKDTVHFDALFEGDAIEDEPEAQDAEPQIDKAEELNKKWQVKAGDMFAIGDHKLLCGDSTKKEDVERLMGGEKATCVFTDPPYGVSIGKKNAMLNTFQPYGRCLDNIEADDMKPEELKAMLLAAFASWKPFYADDCSVFVCSPQGGGLGMMMMMMMMQESGLEVRHILNWVKNCATFSMGRLDYDYQHEPILFTWMKTHKRNKKGQFQTSLWAVDKPRSCDSHATMKPIELPENAILNHTDEGDVVVDMFLGSGTTMIASENTKRKCRGIEISPAYCAVILERMTEAFPDLKVEKL